ncbi:MAG: TRAP transporter small permease [Lautropia sp.]|nr:TRAP transporter small permease [Lautropia sp.]
MTRLSRDVLFGKAFEGVAAICVLGMLLVVSVQVAGRVFASAPPIWTEEISRVLLVLMTCIGSVAVSARGGQIALELFVGKSGPRGLIARLAALISALTGAILAVVAARYAESMAGTSLPVTGLPAYVLQGAFALMGGTIAIVEARRVFGRTRQAGNPAESGSNEHGSTPPRTTDASATGTSSSPVAVSGCR